MLYFLCYWTAFRHITDYCSLQHIVSLHSGYLACAQYTDAHEADPAVSHLAFLRAGRRARCSLWSMLEWRDAAFGFLVGGGNWSTALSHRQKIPGLTRTCRETGLAVGRLSQRTNFVEGWWEVSEENSDSVLMSSEVFFVPCIVSDFMSLMPVIIFCMHVQQNLLVTVLMGCIPI